MEPGNFTGIRVVSCERGPKPHRTPPHGEWEACFTFVLSPAPDDEWAEIFKGIVYARRPDGTLSRLFSGHLEGQRFTIFCHPEQLQLYADELKALVAQTNEYRRDKLKAGDQFAARRQEFEAAIDSALESLEL
jgi:hypothetical protein